MEIGFSNISVLDLKITLESGELRTTVYSKPTDSHLYLQADSSHQPASVKGIQKGVALRLRRICSSLEDFDRKAKEYMAYLVARGHNPITVEKAFKDVRMITISESRQKINRRSMSSKALFVTTYNPLGPNLRGIVKRHSHLLNTDAAKKALPEGVMLAFRREQNLKELLTRADPYSPTPAPTLQGGYTPCKKKCDSCQNFVFPANRITSSATGKSYLVRKDLTCTTENVIYIGMCQKCKKQGVGSTATWKPRLRNYKSHVRKKNRTCGIVKHFVDDCVDDLNPVGHMKFYLIDCLDNTEGMSCAEIDEMLLAKEKFWIGTLVTQHVGLNFSHDWNRTQRTDKLGAD